MSSLFIPLQNNHYCTARYPQQAAFDCSITAFLLWSASKYGAIIAAMQLWHCAVPFRRSLQCSPGFEFGSKGFTNQSPTHCRRLPVHQRRVSLGCIAESASVTSSGSSSAGAGSSASIMGCLCAGLGASLYHIPSLPLSRPCRARWRACSGLRAPRRQHCQPGLRDTLGTRIELALSTAPDLVHCCLDLGTEIHI